MLLVMFFNYFEFFGSNLSLKFSGKSYKKLSNLEVRFLNPDSN